MLEQEKINDEEAVKRLKDAYDGIVSQIHEVIVGMDEVIDEVMIALFSRGHCLLVGVPGLAKTLLVSCLAQTLSLPFKRIQFTPDLMPSDIIGTEILQDDPETRERKFKFSEGPIFANIVLADEINRTPPKTQAALLEAMQEKMISVSGVDYPLVEPFLVLATQNPIEQEGTYPLPEAQLDRFFFNIKVGYPNLDEEIEIMKRITPVVEEKPKLEEVIHHEEILSLQKLVRRVPVADHIFNYSAKLVRATRPEDSDAPDFISEWVDYGASPRASLFLILGAKARAILRGRYYASIEDVQAMALPILRHRIIPSFAGQSEGLNTDDIIKKLLETIPTDARLYGGK